MNPARTSPIRCTARLVVHPACRRTARGCRRRKRYMLPRCRSVMTAMSSSYSSSVARNTNPGRTWCVRPPWSWCRQTCADQSWHATSGSASCDCSCSGLNSCLHAAPGGPSASCDCSCSGLNSCLHAAPGVPSRLRSFPRCGAEAIPPYWPPSPITMPHLWDSSLPWNAFGVKPDQLHLARCLEDDRSWLQRIGRIVHLLGKVQTVMEGGRWVIASAQFADA